MTENLADPILNNISAGAIRDGRFAATGTDREVTRDRRQHTCADDPDRWQRFTHAEKVSESSWRGGGTTSSGDLFQNVASQLAAVFQARGCALALAEELAQKVTGEVKARVREVLWRPGLAATWIFGVLQVGDLTLDLESHIFWRGNDEVHLSPKEFDLLAFMMKNADVLQTHVKLLRSIWGLEYGGELEYLRTTIHNLRKKIEKTPAKPEYIVSVPGIGYRFCNPGGVSRRFAQTATCLEPFTVPISELGGAQ